MTADVLAPEVSLRAILAAASSPAERLAAQWVRGKPGAVASQRYARWEALVASGDAARISRVLHARGLAAEDLRNAFGEPEIIEGGERSDWAATVEHLVTILRDDPDPSTPAPSLGEIAGTGLPSGIDPTAPWRFHAGFRAWLVTADRWLSPLPAPARRSLRNNLAGRLLGTCGPVLMELSTSRELFADPAAEWLAIWSDHPVIARLLAIVWQQWHTVVGEVLERVAADLPAVAPGRSWRDIELGAGDQHAGGRGVAVIVLDDGTRLYLKPRNDGVHHLLVSLFDAIDPERDFGLRLPEVIDRDGYVWVRSVESGDCPDVDAYFYRAGALLRVLQSVGATDLHHENFVAAPDLPVLVDLETALATGLADSSDPVLAAALRDLPGPTSMVTSPVDGPPGTRSADLGALAGPEERLTPYPVRTVTVTDGEPTVRADRLPMANGNALPTVGGSPVALHGHEDALLAGYLDCERRLAEIDAAQVLAAGAATAQVRMVVRPTRVYARLLSNSLSPACLTDGAERELVLERLWRAADTAPAGLIAAEQEAMRDLDVPMFTMPLSGTDLIDDRERAIPGFVDTAPLDTAIESLSSVRPGDGSELRAAVFAARADPASGSVSGAGADPGLALLLERSIECADGHVTWLGLDYDPTRYRWRTGRLGPGLLGDAGVALAMAALADAGSEAADVATRGLLGAAERGLRLDPRTIGSDAFTGPAGILYAAARAAGALRQQQLVASAESLLPAVLAAARASRPTYGMDAVAGAVLAALQLPASPSRDDALAELAELLDTDFTSPFDEPDGWSRAMPSAAAGRLLARHQLAALDLCSAPNRAMWLQLCDPSSVGDLTAMAECGLAVAVSPSGNWWDLLAAAEIERSAAAAGAPQAPTRHRVIVESMRSGYPTSTDLRLGASQAPASWLLSAVHGTAARMLSHEGPDPLLPRVRVMR